MYTVSREELKMCTKISLSFVADIVRRRNVHTICGKVSQFYIQKVINTGG